MRALLNSHVIGPSQLLHTLVTYGPSGNVAILGPVAAGTDPPFVRLLVMASLPRVVPTASSDDLVIEDVATLLADITKQSEVDVRSKGVVETLLAAETVGLLKDHPLLRQLASDMQDGSKREAPLGIFSPAGGIFGDFARGHG